MNAQDLAIWLQTKFEEGSIRRPTPIVDADGNEVSFIVEDGTIKIINK